VLGLLPTTLLIGENEGLSLLPSLTEGKNPAIGLSGYATATSGVLVRGLKIKHILSYYTNHLPFRIIIM
jgi:hypothetical protein